MADTSEALLERAAAILRDAQSVYFITGAGISADSGLPTYRGIGGLYEDLETPDGMPVDVALSGETFEASPEIGWKYIHQLEKACRGARPNAAHHIIAGLEKRIARICVLTQNVDGFHREAGSTDVIDIHGDLHHLTCTRCYYQTTVSSYAELDPVPRCPECQAVIRPDVVLFGELLPFGKVERMRMEQARGFDAVFSIGTSSLFPYVISPVIDATRRGIPTVEINPGQTEVSGLVDVKLSLGAANAMSALRERL